MKKYLFTLLLVTGITGAALACGKDKERKENPKDLRDRQVAAYVTAALVSAYGEPVAGTWQRTAISRDFRQAVYLHREIRKSLFFSGDNTRRLAHIEQVGSDTLPAKLSRKLRKKYKGYRIAQVIRYHDGETLYFVSLEKDSENVLVSYAR